MTHSTLLAHLELEGANDAVCAVSARLADMMGADVIGVAACQPLRSYIELPAGEAIEMYRTQTVQEMKVAEAHFRAALKGKAKKVEWRSDVTWGDLADYIAAQSRAADLIVTAPAIDSDLLDTTRRTDIGGLVMAAGRPVLIVPPETRGLDLKSAVIAWKDTPETRRAVLDALPLLKLAEQVAIVEIAPEADIPKAFERVRDVAGWLERHGIAAEVLPQAANGHEMDCLYRILEDRNCDLIVAGAFGHARLREWAFGGVTQDLLLSPDRCVLLSH
jgi:nucleotide-binding universal stress UspA family protein